MTPSMLLLMLLVSQAPFGLTMGMSRDSLNIEKELHPFVFMLKSVPNPHPDFQLYEVTSTPNAGLCRILAVSHEIKTNAFGHQLIDQFNRIRSEIESIYGKATFVDDELLDGSLWTLPEHWMRGVLEKERRLNAAWTIQSKPTIVHIGLLVSATYSDTGYLYLGYTFENKDSCDQEIAAKKKSPF